MIIQMAKKMKETDMNLYYMQNGQAPKEDIEEMMKRKKAKEREKRIKQNKEKMRKEDNFDVDTEMVIQMTNKNKIKKEEERKKK